MQLEIESNRIEDFLLDSEVINYSHPLVQQKINSKNTEH
ncbi:hypothetical protein SAMN05216225_101165 [Ornithinibacillus halophilus]|uniref:Uncharacterized protein n=1 Tax=Ornithinibacillus halophilus TaxID=930117 RepID=A0A1M5G4L8_9BACI|nr:hypothetical protein SAMN05216225_101165 [Ornithinibacillus halophilus]